MLERSIRRSRAPNGKSEKQTPTGDSSGRFSAHGASRMCLGHISSGASRANCAANFKRASERCYQSKVYSAQTTGQPSSRNLASYTKDTSDDASAATRQMAVEIANGSIHKPQGELVWRVRFAPQRIGTWRYCLRATDRGHFEYSDWTPFVDVGHNEGFDGTYHADAMMSCLAASRVNFLRVWMSGASIYMAPWNPWHSHHLPGAANRSHRDLKARLDHDH